MKNICQIFITDFKRIKTNVVAVVIMLGLIILPSLYAWFNILSNWDPYGEASTSKIKVAVASDDEGVDIEGTYFNMGDKVISALEANTTIGWVFTDTTQEAIEGVYSGDYYVALIMPDYVTSDLVSFLSDDVQHPEIIYYENEKKNAIAPKITAKAKTAVQQQVNATFVSTLAEVLTTAADTLMDTSGLQAMGVANADSLVDVLIDKLNSAITELNTYEALVDSFLTVTDSVTATAETAQNSTAADDAISSGQSAISQAQGALNTGLASYLSISKSLAASLSSVRSLLNSVSESYTQMQDDMAAFNDSLVVMGVNLHQTRDLITDMKNNLQESVNTLTDLKEGDSYQMLMELLSTDPDAIGGFMASPVEIETEHVYQIENYGSAMSPFYSVLALWVGALILVAIVHVKVHPIEGMTDVKPVETYVGRYVLFFLIGQLQTLLTVLGDLYYVGIQCLYPFKFWLAAATASFVFTLFIYSLTVAFGNVGEALAIVVMVIQVAGAGGTFPMEVLPQIYQDLYKYLPFPYAMNALRETVGGLYENYYWDCIRHLLLYIPVSVIIGLVCGKPFEKLNHKIEENKEDSGVML